MESFFSEISDLNEKTSERKKPFLNEKTFLVRSRAGAGRPQAGRRGADFGTPFGAKPFKNLAKMKDFDQKEVPTGP